MIAALQNSREDAPSSSGPAAGPAVPPEVPGNPVADKIAALDVKLDQILALLQKDDAEDAVDNGQENSDNGNPAD